jgi:CRISPR/Cas system-associated exonuclease Cas4 (RecB family)
MSIALQSVQSAYHLVVKHYKFSDGKEYLELTDMSDENQGVVINKDEAEFLVEIIKEIWK